MSLLPTGISTMASAQAKGEITFNEDIGWAMAWAGHAIINFNTSEPPTPTDGDLYYIDGTGSGTSWTGHDNELALYIANNGWRFATPRDGARFWRSDFKILVEYRDGDWCAPERLWNSGGGQIWWTGRYGMSGNKIYQASFNLGTVTTGAEQGTPHLKTVVLTAPVFTEAVLFKSGADSRTAQQVWDGTDYAHIRVDASKIYYRVGAWAAGYTLHVRMEYESV